MFEIESRAAETRRTMRVGRELDKIFFVQVNECWFNACEGDMRKKCNAIESLWYNVAAKFSKSGEATDWSFQLSVVLQEIRSASSQPTLIVNECLVRLGILWIAEELI